MGIKVFSHSIKSFIMLYNNILHDDALVVQLTVSQIKAIMAHPIIIGGMHKS